MLPSQQNLPGVIFTSSDRLAALLEHAGDLDKAEVLRKAIPDWLAAAEPSVVQALNADLAQSHLLHAKASMVLARLKPMDRFCKEQLTTLLKEKWKVEVDVERDTLEIITKFAAGTGTLPFGYESYTDIKPRSLLHAAMENFTDEQTRRGGISSHSLIKINAQVQSGTDITPTNFADLCRKLDLGKRYQQHIHEVLPGPAAGSVADGAPANTAHIRRLKRLDMRVAAHIAYLKKDISSAAYPALLKIIDQDVPAAQVKDAVFDGAPVNWQGLMIHDICLVGVLVFSKLSIDIEPDARCVVYMPNEPRRPFYEYASLDEFKVYLGLHLQSSSYRKRFVELFLLGNDKIDFFSRFDKDKMVGTLAAMPANASSSYFLYSAFVSKIEKDARMLVVPSADVDEQQREKTIQLLLDGGLLLLSAAAFFVPVIGQLMLAAAAVDIVSEVYEGVVDWTHGERKEALTHLLNVTENIAQMAAFAVGGKVVSALGKSVKEQEAFFDGFEAVTRADGKARLWKPDLDPYKQTRTLPADVQADSQGIYRHAGLTSIVMDGAAYRVTQNTAASPWTISHPVRADAFQPAVERNVEGGWRHAYEHAYEWRDDGYALGRTSPRLTELGIDLEPFAEITGLSTDTLHQMHEANLKLPQRLNDCVERVRLENSISDIVATMERAKSANTDFVQEQLHTLPRLPGWPEDRFIEVRDDADRVVARFPEAALHNDAINRVPVSQAQLDAGELLDSVISGLHSDEVEAIIGATTTESQSQRLAKKIGASLKYNRQPLRDWLYKKYDGTATGDAATLHEQAPDLPTRVCQELLENASGRDRSFLHDRKILGIDLTRQVSEAQSAIRQDRALTGLHFPQLASADTDTLALRLMDQVQGWDDGYRLEVRQGSASGSLLDSVGKTDALSHGVIVKKPFGFQVTRNVGNVSSTLTSESLSQAILDALPATQRVRMSLTGNDALDVSTLRARLARAGAGDSARTGRLLRGESSEAAEYFPDCVQADPPAASSYSRGLIRRVRKLFPSFTDAQVSSFLDEAGTTLTLRVNRIRELEQQLRTFRGVLRTWREDEVQMKKLPGPLNDVRVNRRQVANVLENCWRRVAHPRWPLGQPVTRLSLERNPSGPLPSLTEQDVAHVRSLSIKHMEMGDELAYFLKPFKGLVTLELDGNQLTRLPEMLSLMPDLEHLSLNGNRIKLTEHTLPKLAAMRNLRTLGLTGNRLGGTIDVSKMFDLRALFLGETYTTELPVGLARLPYLDIVNLKDNQIKELPDWLFRVPAKFAEKIDLSGNPLSAASLAKLETYRDSTGIGMRRLPDKITSLTEQRARDLWMPHSLEENFASRNRTWQAVKNEPDSSKFFELLADIGGTADSRFVHEDMTRRVWNVIHATQTSPALGTQLLAMAEKARCTDSAATIFSDLEVAVDLDSVVRLSANTHDQAARLLRLGRRMFRLDCLTRIALERVESDKTLDPIEVNLAYRSGLADRLNLVGQPRHMRYAALARTTSANLNSAYNRVVAAELSPELSTDLSSRTFWVDFLRQQYAKQFTDLAAPFHARMQTAYDNQVTLGAEYLKQADSIAAELKSAEADLLKRLTDTAITAEESKVCFAFD
ncbi:NEL-type E3 ubiquitin ligase domain-containing protein [Pseudomonas sp. GB2N2]